MSADAAQRFLQVGLEVAKLLGISGEPLAPPVLSGSQSLGSGSAGVLEKALTYLPPVLPRLPEAAYFKPATAEGVGAGGQVSDGLAGWQPGSVAEAFGVGPVTVSGVEISEPGLGGGDAASVGSGDSGYQSAGAASGNAGDVLGSSTTPDAGSVVDGLWTRAFGTGVATVAPQLVGQLDSMVQLLPSDGAYRVLLGVDGEGNPLLYGADGEPVVADAQTLAAFLVKHRPLAWLGKRLAIMPVLPAPDGGSGFMVELTVRAWQRFQKVTFGAAETLWTSDAVGSKYLDQVVSQDFWFLAPQELTPVSAAHLAWIPIDDAGLNPKAASTAVDTTQVPSSLDRLVTVTAVMIGVGEPEAGGGSSTVTEPVAQKPPAGDGQEEIQEESRRTRPQRASRPPSLRLRRCPGRRRWTRRRAWWTRRVPQSRSRLRRQPIRWLI